MKKKGKGKVMGYNGRIKFRRDWKMNPVERIHSTKKGDKGYDRNKIKRDDRGNYSDENNYPENGN